MSENLKPRKIPYLEDLTEEQNEIRELKERIEVDFATIKQLKEDNSELNQLNADFRNKKRQLVGERDNLKQKLEKVEDFVYNYDVPDYGFPWHLTLMEILKENHASN